MDAPPSTDASRSRPSLCLVEEGIETALNLAGVGVWEHFFPEDQPFCSDGFYQLVGVDPALGRQQQGFWRQRMHPDDLARQDLAYQDFVQGLAPSFEEIYRVRHEQGHWISVLARARWVTRDDGLNGRCALGYVIDVTTQNHDLDYTWTRDERIRMSISALHGVVYDMDMRSRKTERLGLKRMLGYEQVQAFDDYDGWMEIVHPDDRERVKARVVACRAIGSSYEITYRVKHRDGRWRHVCQRGAYALGPDGKPIRAFGVLEDVTEAHEQREQLQMQAAIIERMSEGVMLVARDGAILFANPALERMFGYGRGAMTALNARALSFRTESLFEGLMRTVFEGTEHDRTSVIDLEGKRCDGARLPVQCFFSSMKLGKRRCVVMVATDITERKQLEREVMQVATRVQQRIGGDLHDGLGQQLAGIAMMLQGLARRTAGTDQSGLRGEVDEIVALVNAAIRSTRSLARGLSPVRPTREGLQEGFEELVNQVHERHGIRVHMDLRLPVELQLDENAATNLYRIAQEGVLNAARHAEAQNIHLRFRIAGSNVELLVIDDGKGFDPQQFARGMGLRIMRFRAQLLGGYLAVESRPGGGGTTLVCRCPVNAARVAA
jgi:PAS domain S-box-containing protein